MSSWILVVRSGASDLDPRLGLDCGAAWFFDFCCCLLRCDTGCPGTNAGASPLREGSAFAPCSAADVRRPPNSLRGAMCVPGTAPPPRPRRCPPLLSPRPLTLSPRPLDPGFRGSAEADGVSCLTGAAEFASSVVTGVTAPLEGGTGPPPLPGPAPLPREPRPLPRPDLPLLLEVEGPRFEEDAAPAPAGAAAGAGVGWASAMM